MDEPVDNVPRLRREQVGRGVQEGRAPWATDPAFKALLRKWNGILRRSGLHDIEHQPNPTMGGLENETCFIHHHAVETMRQVRRGEENGSREFYAMAQEYTHLARFKSLRERFAWHLHTMGFPAAATAKQLGVAVNRMWVLRNQMKAHFSNEVAAAMDSVDWEDGL